MGRSSVLQSDITTIHVDAIVNAANNGLMGGGGVDGAIHRKGGPVILEDCKVIVSRQGGCPTGEAVITRAGNLPARFVIHTVGPVWKGGEFGESELLANAYHNSLELAAQKDCKSIVFPNISTGVYHFPKDLAARIAIDTCHDYIRNHKYPEKIIFCCFDSENYHIYLDILEKTQ